MQEADSEEDDDEDDGMCVSVFRAPPHPHPPLPHYGGKFPNHGDLKMCWEETCQF